ncbi:MAG: peptidoglycan DD-metalloendopeptidase family protein [Spirochaetes bacterium]|nr:peptidoglycan DD-metalloendopeptidase family protein [Spirochaetota bacterium]
MFRRVTLLTVLLFVIGLPASAYPRIDVARHGDPVYEQQQAGIEEFYRSRDAGSSLVVFRYAPIGSPSLIALSAQFGLPYSSLASLNRLDHDDPLPAEVLVPNMPGLFVPEEPSSDTERVVASRRAEDLARAQAVTITVDREPTRFRFFPGSDFDRVERLSYLGILFRRPVRDTRISSFYGFRRSPFTAKPSFHSGVDFPGPIGTPVFAAREGEVIAIGIHDVYGRFVRIRHQGGYETFYGHLDDIDVELNQRVSSGMMLGTVGNTGLSTGPHLHFEIRLNGTSRDPVRHLPGLEE